MKTEIEYKVPVTIHDRPIGRCWLVQASKLKWIFKFEISSGDKIHCVGSQMGGFYHLEQQKLQNATSISRYSKKRINSVRDKSNSYYYS